MQGIIEFKDWEKIDLRVAQIINVEDIESADRLYKLEIDLGEEQRTICAGLKEYYSKEELQDKKIIVFTNLAPRKIRGIESQGMLLAAVSEDHKKVVLITPDTLKSTSKDIEIGSRVS